MKNTQAIILTIVLLSALSILPHTITTSANPNTRVTAPVIIDTTLTPGHTLNLTIRVENVGPLPEDLNAWQIRLQVNPSILNITRVVEGPALAEIASALAGSLDFSKLINATGGTAFANDLLILGFPQPSDEGFTGTGDLVYIQVSVIGNGTSTLHLYDTKLIDIDGTASSPISHTPVDGIFSNVSVDLPPVASFTYSPVDVNAGNPVRFDASASSDRDGTIVKYTWNFGDGSPLLNVTVPVTLHTYTTPSPAQGPPLNVTLTVTDNAGLTNSTSKSLFVAPQNLPPVPIFVFSPQNPRPAETVTFNASASYDPDGDLSKVRTYVPYLWDFGDGGTGSGVLASHSYVAVGNYTVTLTVVDATDNTHRVRTSKIITVGGQTVEPTKTAQFPFLLVSAGGAAAAAAAGAGIFLLKRRSRPRESEV